MENIQTVGMWLIKKLCIDTDATTATLELDMTFEGKPIGTYRITIEQISKPLTPDSQ
jgi:hypothetical protein